MSMVSFNTGPVVVEKMSISERPVRQDSWQASPNVRTASYSALWPGMECPAMNPRAWQSGSYAAALVPINALLCILLPDCRQAGS
jgi:hypothetical protein